MFGLAMVLGGLILASASDLDVSGGTVQVFRYEVDISTPTTTIPVEVSSSPATTFPSDTTTSETPGP